jgi:hypothetical protein
MRQLLLAILVPGGLLCGQIRTEVRGTVGHAAFLDESYLNHVVVGGSARFYLTRRLSVEPELLYMRESRRDQDWVLVPNVAFDFRRPGARVVPYAIGGAGLLRNKQTFGTWSYAANSWTVGGGLGAKIFLTERLFVSPEVRIGTEPFFRVTGSIGYVLSRGGN